MKKDMMMCSCCPVTWVSKILLIIGGLNWGIVGIWNYNVVEGLLGAWPVLLQIVYILVGLAALWMLIKLFMMCCNKK